MVFGLARVHKFDKAFKEVSGSSYRDFYEKWRRHINIQYNTIAEIPGHPEGGRTGQGGDGIVIAHNTFEHLPMPIRISVGSENQRIGKVVITDNHMNNTDHGAAAIMNFIGPNKSSMGQLEHVDFLRNKLERIGMRIISGEHGHAVDIRFPETSHIAGNILHRIAGWGLAIRRLFPGSR